MKLNVGGKEADWLTREEPQQETDYAANKRVSAERKGQMKLNKKPEQRLSDTSTKSKKVQ